MTTGTIINNAIKVGGLRDENAKLRRERDALQQQVYDLAAKAAYLEKRLDALQTESFEIIHDLRIHVDRARRRI